jgi:hypothetical protein
VLFLATAFSGWGAALLLGVGASIPWLVRARHGVSLTPHYCIGLLLPAASLLHAWIPMAAIPIRRLDRLGLWIGTAALLVMVCQAALGLALRQAIGDPRRGLRRAHCVSMLLLALLVAGHIVRSR